MNEGRFNLGLIGYPLTHSFSPQMHHAALRQLGLQGEYRLYPIPPLPEGTGQLEDLMAAMRAGKIDGLNVTIPHKRNVISYVDELALTARATGAVNVILRRGQRLVGENTDVAGFLADLQHHLPAGMESRLALVLGAGGAARAVAYGLLREGWQVIIAARRIDQAESLAADLQAQSVNESGKIEPMTLEGIQGKEFQRRLGEWDGEFMLVVNATPLGMAPDEGASPWPPGAAWPRYALAYDLVYNPAETAWMRAARAAGLRAVGGSGMLVEQAALAFELWTDLSASRQVMAMAVSQPIHPTS
jgi:shikimate dehydrogenase